MAQIGKRNNSRARDCPAKTLITHGKNCGRIYFRADSVCMRTADPLDCALQECGFIAPHAGPKKAG